jgi:hypothetical protein
VFILTLLILSNFQKSRHDKIFNKNTLTSQFNTKKNVHLHGEKVARAKLLNASKPVIFFSLIFCATLEKQWLSYFARNQELILNCSIKIKKIPSSKISTAKSLNFLLHFYLNLVQEKRIIYNCASLGWVFKCYVRSNINFSNGAVLATTLLTSKIKACRRTHFVWSTMRKFLNFKILFAQYFKTNIVKKIWMLELRALFYKLKFSW